jgi:hypothetical protein
MAGSEGKHKYNHALDEVPSQRSKFDDCILPQILTPKVPFVEFCVPVCGTKDSVKLSKTSAILFAL